MGNKMRIIAVKTKKDFDAEKTLKKLEKWGFKFNGTNDGEVKEVFMLEHYASGPYHYLFFTQQKKRQWSMFPGNNHEQGLSIPNKTYDYRIITTKSLSEKDIKFLTEN